MIRLTSQYSSVAKMTKAAFAWRGATAAISPTTTEVDTAAALNWRLTFGAGDMTVDFINPPAAGQMVHIVLKLIQDGTGSRGVTAWKVAGVGVTPTYAGGSAPTLTSTGAALDDLHVELRNDGGTYYLEIGLAKADVK